MSNDQHAPSPRREGLSIPIAKTLTGDFLFAYELESHQAAVQLNKLLHFVCPCCESKLVVGKDRKGHHFKHHAKNPDNASCNLYTGVHAERERQIRKIDTREAWQKRFVQSHDSVRQWMEAGVKGMLDQFVPGLDYDKAMSLIRRYSFAGLCANRTGPFTGAFRGKDYLSAPQRNYPMIENTAHAARAGLLWNRISNPADASQDLRRVIFLGAAWRANDVARGRTSIECTEVKRLLNGIAASRNDSELTAEWKGASISHQNRVAHLVCQQAAFLIHHFPYIEALKSQLRESFGDAIAREARYVYFIVDTDRPSWFKIGISGDPAKRARDLETATPGKMLVMDAALFIGASIAEIRIRQKLANIAGGRTEKEWVELNQISIDQALGLFQRLAHDQMKLDALSLPRVQPESACDNPQAKATDLLSEAYGAARRRW